MKRRTEEYQFVTDAFTPDTLPMSRMAEYVLDLSVLLGVQEHIHFSRVDNGDVMARLVSRVDAAYAPRVDRRLLKVRDRTAPREAMRAFDSIDNRLAKDQGSGEIITPLGSMLKFPGKARTLPETVTSPREQCTVRGEVFQIGGRDESISVYLRDGERIYICNASRDQGRVIAKHIFGRPIEVTGDAVWTRSSDGIWKLDSLEISSFRELPKRGLRAAIDELHSIPIPPGNEKRFGGDDPTRLLAMLNNQAKTSGSNQ